MLSEFYFIQPLWLSCIIAIIIWFTLTQHKPLRLPNIIKPIAVFYPLLMALEHKPIQSKAQNSRFWFSIFLILISISLAQPAFKSPLKNTQITQQNVDLMLVVNTSVSMVLRDYKEKDANGQLQQFDRMAKTKRVLKQLVTGFKGKRIGLIVLGRPAALWLPLTGDMGQIQFAIEHLKTTLGGRTSDMGAALQLVSSHIKSSPKQQNMVLLVNDGYLQLGSISPIESIKQLTKKNIIVHTLAIGSPKRPNFSLGLGHLIYSPVDLKLMQTLATTGNGKMIHAWQNNTAEEILAVIDQPVITPKSSLTRFKNTALYGYPLSVALCIMLLMLFPIHRLKNRQHEHSI